MIWLRFWHHRRLRVVLYSIAACSVGCSTYPPEVKKATGYRYATLIRDSSGHYRSGNVLDLGETFVYQYGFWWRDLVEIDKDLAVAAKSIIKQRSGVPPECTGGIKIIEIIRGENGGVAANVECN